MTAILTLALSLAQAAQGGQVTPPAVDPGGPLTLEQAVAIAERNAFAVRVARTNVEQSRQRLAESRGRLGPQATVGSTYTRFGQESTATFPGPTGQPQTIVTQPIDNTVANANISLPLDISGNLGRLVSASRANLRASERTLEATVSDARLLARRAFFNALRAQGLVDVAQSSLRSAVERLEQARKQFAADEIARVDVVRFEALVAQNHSNLIAARNNYTLAREALNAALARPIETPVDPVEVGALPAPPPGPDVLVRAAQEGRQEVQALNQTLDALANLRRAEERGLNPSLAVSLGYQRNLGTIGGFGGREETTTGVLAFSMPVFDAGITRARVRAARQDEERTRVQLEQLRLGISQEVRAALNNLDSARGRLEAATSQVTFAEEILRLARVRRDAGEATFLEVVDAERELTTARNNLVAARYDYLTAYSELQRAVGADDLTAVAVRPTTPNGLPEAKPK